MLGSRFVLMPIIARHVFMGRFNSSTDPQRITIALLLKH